MRSKGLFRVTMENQVEPNSSAEKIKWHNRIDEAYGLLCLSISKDLLFHLDGLTSPNEVWEKIQTLFRNTNKMRGHQLENDLISLILSNFETFEDYLSKFKSLVLQVK